MPRSDFGGLERGDDKAGIGLAARPFGFAYYAAVAAPAVQRGPGEVAEPAGGLLGGRALRRRLGQFGLDLLDLTNPLI
jgi:hypothetical protein